MIGIQGLLVIVATMLIAGATIFSIVEDVGYAVACGFCPEGQAAAVESVATITTAGQNQVRDGTDGILYLREHKDELDPVMFNLLLATAQRQIYGGTFLTLVYIFFFYFVISRIAEWTVGFAPPFLIAVGISILMVGLVTWAFNGFDGFPFDGWIHLLTHWDIWATKFIDAASPVPSEIFNTTQNETIGL